MDCVAMETERLILREMREDDMDALRAILADDQTMYAYEGAFDESRIRSWLHWQLQNYSTLGYGLWAVVLRDTGVMIGQCGLTIQPWREGKVLEIGYLFNRYYWHHGYAAEAARACRDYAFRVLGAEEVSSIIRDTNIASQRVALQNGMQPVDRWTKRFRGTDMPHDRYCVRSPLLRS